MARESGGEIEDGDEIEDDGDQISDGEEEHRSIGGCKTVNQKCIMENRKWTQN